MISNEVIFITEKVCTYNFTSFSKSLISNFKQKNKDFRIFFQSDSQSETKSDTGSNPGGGNTFFCNQFAHFDQFYSNTTIIFSPNLTLVQVVLPLSGIRKRSDIFQIYDSDIVC